ncbi:MAG: hypothetical protein MUF49_00095 [Oculatellaceae cyanobacterium Prado106]|nr:hypothetical protein [Oculatellaceae cyanobacterium Prado106]
MPNLITVTTTADSGLGSLRAAIATAQDGDTIRFSSTLANQTIRLTSGDILIPKNIEIDGANANNLAISGNFTSRIFSAGGGVNFTVKNLALINGKTSEKGGAIWLRDWGTTITVVNCQFNNNEAGIGGAIQIGYGGRATVLDSSFDGNQGISANNGFSAGAIANDGSGETIIRNSRFSNNVGFNGGAIYSLLSPLTVENSTFINNRAIGEGGGAIFTDGGNPVGPSGNVPGQITVKGSWFEGNQAQGEGGALFLYGYPSDRILLEDSTVINNRIAVGAQGFGRGVARGGGMRSNAQLTIRNVTFAHNTSDGQGGGIWVDGGSPINIFNSTFSGNRVTADMGGAMTLNTDINAPINIVNSTIVNNWANRASGAFWLNNPNQPVTLTNSIVAFNTASLNGSEQQVGYQPRDGGGNIEFPAPSQGRRVAQGSLIANPQLESLQNINGRFMHPLLPTSPAINRGVRNGATLTDQRGAPRDSSPDIGAFELLPPNSTLSTPTVLTRITGTPRNDTLIGLPNRTLLNGLQGNDLLIATSQNDILWGGDGRDTLNGGLGSDILLGGLGADRHRYSGINQNLAHANSNLNSMDQIRDFNPVEGDRIQLDTDRNPTTAELPTRLSNAGTQSTPSLIAAIRNVYTDKNFVTTGQQALGANEAVFFEWNLRTYLIVNNNRTGFSATEDLFINVTGMTVPSLHTSSGTLSVGRYFV